MIDVEISHSRIECFEGCPFKYKLKYLDKLKTLKNTDDANNPLYLGTALHTGIEKDVETAIKEYYSQYPIITDDHINEAIKLRYLIPKAKEMLPPGDYEVPIKREVRMAFRKECSAMTSARCAPSAAELSCSASCTFPCA